MESPLTPISVLRNAQVEEDNLEGNGKETTPISPQKVKIVLFCLTWNEYFEYFLLLKWLKYWIASGHVTIWSQFTY